MRQFILFILLAVMLGALWYDRKIARPNVQSAYDRIETLNDEINLKKGHEVLTNKEVQAALNRPPSRVFSIGGYHVEVYSWRAGLPIKTHDYYAVFAGKLFLKHYKFELPTEELTGTSAYITPPDPSMQSDQLPGGPISERPGSMGGRNLERSSRKFDTFGKDGNSESASTRDKPGDSKGSSSESAEPSEPGVSPSTAPGKKSDTDSPQADQKKIPKKRWRLISVANACLRPVQLILYS